MPKGTAIESHRLSSQNRTEANMKKMPVAFSTAKPSESALQNASDFS